MKNFIRFTILIFLFCSSTITLNAQNPCSGTPGANTVIPLSQTICAGTSINLTLANNYSTTGITYQWQTSTISIVGPFTPVPGATLHAYNTPTLAPPQGGIIFYSVIITCTNSGLTITIPYSITIVNCNSPCSGTPTPANILPVNHTVCIGNSAAMSLSTTYTETGITYQWYNAPAASGPYTSVNGATLSSYVSPALSTTSYFQVVVTCTNSNVSFTVTHVVTAVSCTFCSGPPPSNTITPLTQTLCAGSSVTLALANTYSASGYTFQWQQSTTSAVGPFSPILGATSSTYATPSLTNTTYFNIVITCTNGGQNISLSKAITIVPCNSPCSGPPSSNTILPLSQTICVGDASTLSLANTYSQTGITYQWGASPVVGGPYTVVPNATLVTYGTPTMATNGFYNVTVTCNNGGQTFVTTRSISVISCTFCSGTPSTNTLLPVSATICAGNSLTLSLANTYTASGLTYQWQSSTISPVGPFSTILGSTNSTYAVTNLTVTTYFNVVITCTNSGNSISLQQVVYVVPCQNVCTGTPASNTVLPISHTLCAGNTALMNLSNSYTTTGITYQWQSSTAQAGPFISIAGATLTSYTSGTLNATTFYNVVITCTASGLSTNAAHTVTVNNCGSTVEIKSENKATEKIVVFPNPNKGLFTVKCSENSLKTIQVFDLVGRKVFSVESRQENILVDIQTLPAGMYTALIQGSDLYIAIKIMKE